MELKWLIQLVNLKCWWKCVLHTLDYYVGAIWCKLDGFWCGGVIFWLVQSYKANCQLYGTKYAKICHWVFSNDILTENLTMFPTSDQRIKTIFSIAHNLSYNILKLGRKLWNNNRDTGQRTLSCRFMFWKKWTAIDITRNYEELCIVAFNRKFDYDDVTKLSN